MYLRRFFLVFTGLCSFSWGAESAGEKLRQLIIEHQKEIPFKRKFTQVKTLKEMNLELPSEGTLEVKALGQATWQILKPSYLKVELTADEIKIYSDPGNAKGSGPKVYKKEQFAKGNSDFEGGEWMGLLTRQPDEILNHFEIVEKATRSFQLTPKEKNAAFEWVEFRFSNGKKHLLEGLVIQENKDDRIEFKFKK